MLTPIFATYLFIITFQFTSKDTGNQISQSITGTKDVLDDSSRFDVIKDIVIACNRTMEELVILYFYFEPARIKVV